MAPARCRSCRRKWIIFVFLMGSSSLFSQGAPANPQSPVQVPPAAGSAAPQENPVPCTPLAETGIPIRSTIEARVVGLLESNRLKPGKKLWVNSVFEMSFPECHMVAGAAVYGRVTASSSSKDPNASELAIAFDAADCLKREHQPLRLVVVGMIAAPDDGSRGHNAAPTELQGGSRQISDTAASTNGYDANLSAALPTWVQPGYMAGFRNLRLDPQGGPQCSSRLVSTDRSIALPVGTVFLLAPLGDTH